MEPTFQPVWRWAASWHLLFFPEAIVPPVFSLTVCDLTNETQKISVVSLASSSYSKPAPDGKYPLRSLLDKPNVQLKIPCCYI